MLQNNSKIGNEVGRLGEDLAIMFLKKRGHFVVDRNVLIGGGEIDLITKKDGIVHFVEVKSILTEIKSGKIFDKYNPIQNVDKYKFKTLSKAMLVYVSVKNVKNWQFDVLGVEIDKNTKKARFDLFEDQIFEY